jgi:threonyl-tRNA synthetase
VELSREEVLRCFAGEDFKTELISDLPEGETITVYENRTHAEGSTGSPGTVLWTDLCRGFHVHNTREMNIAGDYWREDEKRPMLTRIYGTALF